MIYRPLDISVLTGLSRGIHSAHKKARPHEAGLDSQSGTTRLHSPWSLICACSRTSRFLRYG
jgi:hypothetical protein